MYHDDLQDSIELFNYNQQKIPHLRIMIIIDQIKVWGGLETYIIDLIQEWVRQNHTVFVDCLSLSSDVRQILSLEGVVLWEGETFEHIQRLIHEHSVDVLFTQAGQSAERCYRLSQAAVLPFVLTFHGPISVKSIGLKYVRAAAKLIAVSKETEHLLLETYPEMRYRVSTVQNGVRIPQETAITTNFKTESPVLLFIGRLDHDRSSGLFQLIKAYRRSSFGKLIIVGSGTQLEQLREAADPTIQFAGSVSNPEVWIRQADVVVATGRGCREAMSLGKPCIVISSWGYDGLVNPFTLDQLEYANFSGRSCGRSIDTETVWTDLKKLEDHSFRLHLGEFGYRTAKDRYAIGDMAKRTALIAHQAVRRSKKPKVSVIMPVYNHADELPSAVNSLLKRTFTDFELIIVNDGSTDHFDETMRELKDPRIRILNNPENRKLPYTINKGLPASQGAFVTWTSADNLLLPEYLKELVQALEENPEFGSVYSDYQQIDAKDNIIQTLSKGAYTLDGNTNYGPSFLYRREAAQQVGLFDESLFGVEDRDYSIRMAIEAPVLWIDKALYQYRVHDHSLTGAFKKNPSMFSNAIEAIRKKWNNLLTRPVPPTTTEQDLSSVKWEWKRHYRIPASMDCTLHSLMDTNLDLDPMFVGKFYQAEYRYLIDFSLADIPKEAEIIDAWLELFIIRNDNSSEKELILQPVIGPWDEKTVKSSLAPAIHPNISVSVIAPAALNWIKIPLFSIIDSVQRGQSQPYGWMIRAKDPQNTLLIAANNRHHEFQSLRPRLCITTTGPIRGKRIR